MALFSKRTAASFDHNTPAERLRNTEAPGHAEQVRRLRSSERLCRIGMTAGGQGRLEADHDPLEERPMFSESFGVPRPVCLGP